MKAQNMRTTGGHSDALVLIRSAISKMLSPLTEIRIQSLPDYHTIENLRRNTIRSSSLNLANELKKARDFMMLSKELNLVEVIPITS
jgi:hypothetical protein